MNRLDQIKERWEIPASTGYDLQLAMEDIQFLLSEVERLRESCKQGKKRIENFEVGFRSEGAPSTPFQMHVMVTLNAIKQDFEEALNGKN